MSSRLALGTVQFGLPYGIANRGGQVSRAEAAAILDFAWGSGLDTLDTAIDYGESEQRLGEMGVGRWKVVSKLPAMPQDRTEVADWVRASVAGSLQRLRTPRLYGLLLHRPQQLLGPRGDALYRALVACKEEQRVGKIGVSIYGPEELDALWPRYKIDIVQAPFNILDRRLASSGWLTRLRDAEIEIHVRSIFLQGLLLMSAPDRPGRFSRWEPLWGQWHRWLAEQALTAVQACTAFALSRPGIDRVVVGVESLAQLQAILRAADAPAAEPPASLASEDPDLINPSRWSLH
jgi:aryl-alcohol dehydrogenase-like predicted oxidoreductase